MRLGRNSQLLCAGIIAFSGASYVLTTPGQARSEWASSNQMIQGQFAAESSVRPLSAPAARVALTALALNSGQADRDAFAAMTVQPAAQFDMGAAGTIQVAVLDDAARDASFGITRPGRGEHSPVVVDPAGHETIVAVNYERPFVSRGEGEQLDVSLTPRAAVSLGPDGSAAGAGAEVRIGRYLADDYPSWYVFAGADRRALMYDPAQGMDFNRAVYMTSREVIGDAQAGVAMRVGEVDLSLAYVQRNYRYVVGVDKFRESDNFGAVTVNWRW
ncbi:lipid A-modifier LpxR family protein [uncultured Maricaulis sp.]|uniref:lipid A-modifier LpxR family protein n=1 Tax=uncultured Maricaulis sp. TaxID=174710 RepID=UPI0030D711F0|tara:strand:+ start:52994 stop:53812 length:819 start_codon:yes stop_codon:yes gene_type:complete